MLRERMRDVNIPLFVRSIALVLSALALCGCAQDVLPINCKDTDVNCYVDQATKGIIVVRQNIAYWSNVNFIAQLVIVISGTVATVMIALQGDQNRYWTRPVGLVATALVTGLTSALVSFHVPDNIDKLVDVVADMTTVTNDFDYRAVKLVDGKSPQEIEEAFRTDKVFRESLNDLTKNFSDQYNKIKIDMLKLSGSGAKLNSLPSTKPSSNPSQPQAKPGN